MLLENHNPGRSASIFSFAHRGPDVGPPGRDRCRLCSMIVLEHHPQEVVGRSSLYITWGWRAGIHNITERIIRNQYYFSTDF